MFGKERCDEIIRLIDEVLAEVAGVPVARPNAPRPPSAGVR